MLMGSRCVCVLLVSISLFNVCCYKCIASLHKLVLAGLGWSDCNFPFFFFNESTQRSTVLALIAYLVLKKYFYVGLIVMLRRTFELLPVVMAFIIFSINYECLTKA